MELREKMKAIMGRLNMIKYLILALCLFFVVDSSKAIPSKSGWGDDEGVSLIVVRQSDETETPIEWACINDPLKLIATVSGLDEDESVQVTIYDDETDVGELDSEGNIHWKENYSPTLGRHKFKAKAVFSANGRSDQEVWSEEVEVLIFRINLEIVQGENALAEDDEESEGPNEMTPGGFVGLNDNDDDGDGLIDKDDSVVSGEKDMMLVRITFEPEAPGDGVVMLSAVFQSNGGRIRAWKNETKQNEINLLNSPVWFVSQLTSPTEVYIEGTVTSYEVGDIALTAEYRSEADGGLGSSDSAKITVIAVNLDISRRGDDDVVDQDLEHGEGSIIKAWIPETDFPTLRDLRNRVRLPNWSIYPESAKDYVKFKIAKVGPQASVAGKLEVLRGADSFLSDEETEKDVTPAQLNSDWKAEGRSPGVVDLALIAEIDNFEVDRDQVRLTITYVDPNDGAIGLVSPGNELDLPRYGWKAFRSIKAACAIGGANDNVAIARGTYNESNIVGTSLIVGLGGAYDGSNKTTFKFNSLPKVDGGGTVASGSVFVLNGGAKIACLEITGGLSTEGGAIFVKNQPGASVSYCKVVQNKARLSGGSLGYGAGIFMGYCSGTSTIHGCLIEENTAFNGGGGLYVMESSVTVEKTLLQNNTASIYGGGLVFRSADGSGSLTLKNSTISGNSAADLGGGVALIGETDDLTALIVGIPYLGLTANNGGSASDIDTCEIIGNRTTYSDPTKPPESRGGGIFAHAEDTKLNIVNSKLAGNVAMGDGGALCTFTYASVTATNNSLIGNSSAQGDGGAISQGAVSSGDWKNNKISGNTGTGAGGGLHQSVRGATLIKDNEFSDNTSNGSKSGGGIYMRNSYLGSNGGNLFKDNSSVVGSGGGIYVIAQPDKTFVTSSSVYLKSGDTFKNNSANVYGGGVFAETDSDEVGSITLAVDGVTFDGNAGGSHSDLGAQASGIFATHRVYLNINNSLFKNHQGAACGIFDSDTLGKRIQGLFTENDKGVVLAKCKNVTVEYSVFDNNKTHAYVNKIYVDTVIFTKNTFKMGAITTFGVVVDKSDSKVVINENNFIGHNIAAGGKAVVADVEVPGAFYGWYFVNAKKNWWNHPDGPFDPLGNDDTTNGNPAGDRVFDCIDYSNWATVPY